LLKYLKIKLDTDLKIILVDHENNDVERSSKPRMLKLCAALFIMLERFNYFQ